MRIILVFLIALSLLAGTRAARGEVIQPNGTVVPAAPNALAGYLNGSANNDNINEQIDVRKDAAVDPQIFAPLCQFSGKYIAKGGGANFAIGWYNVDDKRPSNMPPRYVPVNLGANLNNAAPASDIQILFPFSGSLPPQNQRELNAASIRMSPAYKGGYIGLVLIPNPNGTGTGNATQYHYTEHRYNVQCTRCTNPGPWYSHLTYRSNKLANTFYLGFEDLDFRDAPGNQGLNGNDLDYEDFLFRFTGLACPGAGVPCQVPGGKGACGLGITDCDANGQLACRARVNPGAEAERCDGFDNDCDGAIDNGAPCPPGKLCDRGRCVDPCGQGEFQCDVPLVCDRGVCIDPPCVGKTCPDGQVCRDGVCRGVCGGVICPPGKECRADRCVDPCAGVMCKVGQVCLSGVCITTCECRACEADKACGVSGRCEEKACQGVNCPAGTYCDKGNCLDGCMGVVCPPNEMCEMGECVPVPPPPDMAGPRDFAVSPPDLHGSSGTTDDAGSGQPGGGNLVATGGGGCSCQVGGRRPAGSEWIAALLLSMIWIRTRAARRPKMNSAAIARG